MPILFAYHLIGIIRNAFIGISYLYKNGQQSQRALKSFKFKTFFGGGGGGGGGGLKPSLGGSSRPLKVSARLVQPCRRSSGTDKQMMRHKLSS